MLTSLAFAGLPFRDTGLCIIASPENYSQKRVDPAVMVFSVPLANRPSLLCTGDLDVCPPW